MTDYERGIWAALGAMQEAMGVSDYTYNITDEVLHKLGLGDDNQYDDEED